MLKLILQIRVRCRLIEARTPKLKGILQIYTRVGIGGNTECAPCSIFTHTSSLSCVATPDTITKSVKRAFSHGAKSGLIGYSRMAS